jgi:hypothetical protein
MSFDYRKVMPSLWTGKTGRWLRKQPATVTVVAMYLVTCPSSTQWGLFYLPAVLIANDTGRGIPEVMEALGALDDHGFCKYDTEAEVVWVVNMCRDQVGAIRGGDKRAKPAAEAARELLDMPFGVAWYRHYEGALQLPPCPIDAPSMPHPEPADAPSMPGSGSGSGAGAGSGSGAGLLPTSPPAQPALELVRPEPSKPRFDFEALYRTYPRKEGKRDGMRICERDIRTPADFEALTKAVANYASIAKPGFVKHWSSFMANWRDYVEPIEVEAAMTPEDRAQLERARRWNP